MLRRKFIKHTVVATTAIGMTTLSCTSCIDAEYLILGGGLSGLHTAYLLEKAGKDYVLLEGSSRLGGRLYQHPQLNRDVGGRGIGDRYDEVMTIVKALEVELVDITSSMRSPSAIYVDGQLHESWPSRGSNPSRLEFSKLSEAPSLASLEEWYQRPDLDIPYSDFLKSLGHDDKDLELINVSTNYNDVYTTSAINPLHSRAFRTFNGSSRIYNFKGGSGQLIGAIADQLSNPVYTDKMVTLIEQQKDCVKVRCNDDTVYCAHKVICTLPFSTLRDVSISADLNANQAELIKSLPYTKITQIHFQVDDPYWEIDEMPASMWTDTPLERIMSMDSSLEKGHMACWINGEATAYFDNMSDSDIEKYLLSKLKEIRPSTEGRISYVGTHNWGQYKYNKGAYCEFGVGHTALFEDAIQPAGDIHFAGEHTARKNRGIEAAAESARRVVEELIG